MNWADPEIGIWQPVHPWAKSRCQSEHSMHPGNEASQREKAETNTGQS